MLTKILVLGESHYCGGCDACTFRNQCDIAILNSFWNSIIFYSYVQKSTDSPRVAPTQQMFKDSEDTFLKF
jgi:hypothetical protein